MLERFRTVLGFISGLILVVSGLLNERPRAFSVVIGLSLMGVSTIPEAVGVVSKKKNKKGD